MKWHFVCESRNKRPIATILNLKQKEIFEMIRDFVSNLFIVTLTQNILLNVKCGPNLDYQWFYELGLVLQTNKPCLVKIL